MQAEQLYALCQTLYPLCRSISGEGTRQTLNILSKHIALEVVEVPTGTQVFDWQVPREWSFRHAYIEDPAGARIIDTTRHNLHIMSYSSPVDTTMTLDELQPHLHSLPEQPDLIPYRTNYYTENWGFCLADNQRKKLEPGTYRVRIDAALSDGALTYGEAFVPGWSNEELLISTHICHPSLANDNLSGIAVATALAQWAARKKTMRYGLRFVFVPSTIGAITWLATNQTKRENIVAGLVISGVGDSGKFNYKLSKRGAGPMDRALSHLVAEGGGNVRPFLPYGYDERQYCSPGIDIPMGCIMRTPYGEYPEYHTSADNLEFISASALQESFELCRDAIERIQRGRRYISLNPHCEPQLGRRGLYQAMGGNNDTKDFQLALLWVLGYSDGQHSLEDIAALSQVPLSTITAAAERLESADLVRQESPK